MDEITRSNLRHGQSADPLDFGTEERTPKILS
jgi:hypothetical protein